MRPMCYSVIKPIRRGIFVKKLLVLTLLVLTLLAAYAKTPKDTLVIAANTEIFITLDPAVCYETFLPPWSPPPILV